MSLPETFSGLSGLFAFLHELSERTGIVLTLLGISVLVLAVSAFMWIAGGQKLRKTDAFLSYRTLRDTLKAEKKQS